MTKSTAQTTGDIKREIDALDVLPPKQAQQRTDELLRNLLNAPPHPHQAPKKSAKLARKKPRNK